MFSGISHKAHRETITLSSPAFRKYWLGMREIFVHDVFLRRLFANGFVGFGIHQTVQFGLIVDFNFANPVPESIFVQ